MFWAYFEETALVVYPNSGVQLLTYLFLVLGSFIFPMILLIILKEKQEHDIIISNNSLKLLNKNKSNFFSIIAHDLKGPLGTYTKLIELLLNKHKEMPINQREEFLMKLHNSSTQMFNLLENLLKWSKVESGTTKVHPNDTVLKDIINPVALLMKNSLDLKNLDLVIAIPEEETVYCDYNMIMTVIRNLLSNAIKFTPNNGKITILSKKVNDNYLEIRIEDTGVGIPSKDLNSIFDLNSDLNTNGTNNETGTGLGLKLAKEYIKKNNGTIGIESVVNVGTTVWIHLPTKKTLQT
ncbi:sensor histidine kinase [Lutibacter sp.]|uniref:sensor histidine kinase n=1 Tax=Lutibacter sp. TaxID=1925666 RepID=UPI00356621BE